MILVYKVLSTLIYPLLLLFIIFRKIIKKEDQNRYKEKIFVSHFNVIKKKGLKLIWFHAASIGEFKSILPIIEELNNENNNLEFLITTITLSSSNLAKEELRRYKNVQHRFFPFDVNFLIKEFILLWKPDAVFFVDSEIWPNLLSELSRKKIPIGLINGRITSRTYKRWMLFPQTAKKIFSLFDLCLVSNLETKNYLLKLDAKNIFFNGNIKLISKNKKDNENLNKEVLVKKRFWLAASTHDGEEFFCLQTHLEIKKIYDDIVTIIAPRHIDRIENIKRICENLNLKFQILNENEKIKENHEVVIINSFGVLSNYFECAKSVFIGKSLIEKLKNDSGQNPIDAAKSGCKVYHGPYVYNFEEIYEILKKSNISKKIISSKDLAQYLIKDLENPLKKNTKISLLINDLGKKTLVDTMKNINKFLFNEIK